jgi:peroxiredoxin
MVQPERLATVDRAIAELRRSGIAARALQAGAKIPSFELPDGDGMIWRSEDLLRKGPLVIVFYRGRWCAYCNAQLVALQAIHQEIAITDASLAAISPQTAKHTYMTRDMHGLRFPVLSDSGNDVARDFGLVYRLPSDLEQMYQSIMTRLPGYNGDQTWELPMPATYIVGTDGVVRYACVHVDWRQRTEPQQILAEL